MSIKEILEQLSTHPFIARSSDPGRLHTIMQFEPLPLDQAKKIYHRECGRDDLGRTVDGRDWTLAEVYAKAKEHDNKAKKKVKVNIGAYA